jgi:predicted  nucleic acid-binding Zn-ribbon protein
MTIDNESPAGAWQKEWDARAHTESEYRAEIRDMRDRIKMYLKEIDDLKAEIHLLRDTLYSWKAKDGCDR